MHFQGNVKRVSQEVQRLHQEIESSDIKSSGKYDELKAHLIGVAAAVGIGLAVGNFTEQGLNGISTFMKNSVNIEFISNVGSNNKTPEVLKSPAIESFTEKAVKNQSTLSEDSKDFQSAFNVDALMRAIIGQESAGKFNITNPHSGALGYGQVMPENVSPWSLEALGYELKPEQFLQSPKLQLKIIRYKLRQAIASQTKPGRTRREVFRRASAVWYSGQGDLWDNTRPQFYNGHPYPSISEYTQSVWQKYLAESKSSSAVHAEVKTQSSPEIHVEPKKQEVSPAKAGIGNLLLNFFQPQKAQASTTSAPKIVAYMEKQGYEIFRNPGEVNIIHVRNGAIAKDLFEDKRIVLQFVNGAPVITGEWAETTKPGLAIVHNPINPNGAIAIAPGQYRSWQVGIHVGQNIRWAHEALLQTGGSVTGYRDGDRNRVFETVDRGFFGVNIHEPWSKGSRVEDRSAGCMVTATKSAHRAFMKLVKNDPRFVANPNFVFSATVIDGRDL